MRNTQPALLTACQSEVAGEDLGRALIMGVGQGPRISPWAAAAAQLRDTVNLGGDVSGTRGRRSPWTLRVEMIRAGKEGGLRRAEVTPPHAIRANWHS